MRNSKNSIAVPEGGAWGGEHRRKIVNSVAGMYEPNFVDASASTDPAIIHWVTQLQNILTQSYTEQNSYDFKQGFLRLDKRTNFDGDNFTKILHTCIGISNLRKGSKGYVLVGIVDKENTVNQIKKLFGVDAKKFKNFYISGVDHDIKELNKTPEQFFQLIVDKIGKSEVSEPLRRYMLTNLKSVRYFDKTVYVFEVQGQDDPSSMEGRFFIRRGARLAEIE